MEENSKSDLNQPNSNSRLFQLKQQNYLTKRIFPRISENMHYELFKYLTNHELLEIRALKLGGYQLTSNETLRSRIKNYYPAIKEINITNTRINLIFEQTGKRVLSFEGMRINSEQIKDLVNQIVKSNLQIEGLNLKQNSIQMEGAITLSERLLLNSTLKDLDISFNSIGKEGVNAVAMALKLSDSLKNLNIANNSIGGEGAYYISEALKMNQGYNSISLEGGLAISESLKLNKSLTNIDLSYNMLHDEGAKSILVGLKMNSGVKIIDLKGNDISKNGAIFILKQLKLSPSLSEIQIVTDSIRNSKEFKRSVSNYCKNTSICTFDELNIREELLRGIYGYGYEKPSYIQSFAIIAMLERRDIIAQSQSGSGKTGGLAIGCLGLIDENINECQALILVPTRDLARSTGNIIKELGHYINIHIYACEGGVNQMDIKNASAHILIGTPGRVYQLIHRGILKLNSLKLLILDEAEDIIERGFRRNTLDILERAPEYVQLCFFSVALSDEILEVCGEWMIQAATILARKDVLTLNGIKQFYVTCEKEEYKLDTLFDILQNIDIQQIIIYCDSARKVEWISGQLTQRDITSKSVHQQMDKLSKYNSLYQFRIGNIRILIADHFVIRSVDIYNICQIIFYDLPKTKEEYLPIIGRSGCYGRKGAVINFITEQNSHMLQEIRKYYCTEIEELFDLGNI